MASMLAVQSACEQVGVISVGGMYSDKSIDERGATY
jgi:hypothetical protein